MKKGMVINMEFWDKRRKKKRKNSREVLLQTKKDRRILNNVPDATHVRENRDRRGDSLLSKDADVTVNDFIKQKAGGIRYIVDYDVKVMGKTKSGEKFRFLCKGVDISTTGILLKISNNQYKELLKNTDKLKLRFEIEPGSMPEGYEMKVKTYAKVCRINETEEGEVLLGASFKSPLSQYANQKKGRYDLLIASLFLFSISMFIVLMRAESIIYFKFNKWLYLYSIVAAAFLLSRYLFSMFYRPVPVDPDFTPGVTIIIPCFNEEEWIQRTILSCINQDYPVDKLEVIVVDDCSNDKSVEKVKEIMDRLYQEADQFRTKERLKCIVQHKNAGKREALVLGVEAAKHDLVVFVDSDSFLDPFAIRNLVQPFKDPKMGGCAGRTDVANTYTNSLTKMQSVRYYIAFRVMKAAEGYFDTVSCLSGPLSCYRKEIIMENKDAWLQQKFLGQKATFGDDRSMTNFVLRKHRTTYQDTAICSTIVPSSHKVFLKQQMRWKRSWLRESLIAGKFMWRKEPFASLGFYMGLFVPIAAPIVVFYNLLYVPLTHHIFPTTFLVGILMMSLMMSMAQLLLRRSSTWLYGMLFCIYYEVVLLWQMPVAWVTFWKSTWGTRLTPSDILAMKKKQGKNAQEEVPIQEETGDAKPTEGISVITAFQTCYLKDDTNLTPETAMINNAGNNAVNNVTDNAQQNQENSQEEAVAPKMEVKPANASEPTISAIEASVKIAETTEETIEEMPVTVAFQDVKKTLKVAMAPIEKQEKQQKQEKITQVSDITAQRTTGSKITILPKQEASSEEIEFLEQQVVAKLKSAIEISMDRDFIQEELAAEITEVAKEIVGETKESILMELKTKIREEVKASVMEGIEPKLKREMKKQIMMDLLSEEGQSLDEII